jgi:CHASE2 domain-containing sensor protein
MKRLRFDSFSPLSGGRTAISISLTIVFTVLLARFLGLLEPLDLFLFDVILKLRIPEPQDSRLLLVAITAADLEDIGNPSQIPPQELIHTLTLIQEHEPAVIGLNVLTDLIDSVDPEISALSQLINQQENIFAAEKLFPPFIYPPPGVDSEKVGFVDLLPDSDQRIRRSILGSSTLTGPDEFKFSLPLLLSEFYLEQKGITLENGIADESAMRFGQVEIPRIYPDTGGYRDINNGGVQALINYRSGRQPFKEITLTQLKLRKFQPSDIQGKIVIIGVTDPQKRFELSTPVTSAVDGESRLSGLHLMGHFTSHIVSAALDGRLSLHGLYSLTEGLLLVCLGLCFTLLSFDGNKTSPLVGHTFTVGWMSTKILLSLFIVFVVGYSSLTLAGIWMPIAPLMVMIILSYSIALYTSLKDSEIRIEERRKVIERTFDILHNGPLQSISIIMHDFRKGIKPNDLLIRDLNSLSQEIRDIGEYLKEEGLIYEQSLYLKGGFKLDLSNELHELLHQVYSKTLEADFSNFRELLVRIRSFDEVPLRCDEFALKREICRYLEESICNVGKHARNPTLLKVLGKRDRGWYVLSVEDNGALMSLPRRKGQGTNQSHKLARKLKAGKFTRTYSLEKGTTCELRWKI